jgi:hypothetical protein
MRNPSLRRAAFLALLKEDVTVYNRRSRPRRKRVTRTLSKANDADNAYDSTSGRPYIAGVPLARPTTTTGERLLKRLVDRPHIFIQGVQEELAYISGEADKPSSIDWTDRGVGGGSTRPLDDGFAATRFTPPQASNGCAAQPDRRKRATQFYENDYAERSTEEESQWRFNVLRQGTDGWSQYGSSFPLSQVDYCEVCEGSEDGGVLADLQTFLPSGDVLADLERECRKDVLYTWAVAEAYLRHPIMQAAMK